MSFDTSDFKVIPPVWELGRNALPNAPYFEWSSLIGAWVYGCDLDGQAYWWGPGSNGGEVASIEEAKAAAEESYAAAVRGHPLWRCIQI